jgi:hypothetical protein
MVLTIRPATDDDAQWLADHLRVEDHREIETASGRSPQEIVPLSVSVSRESYTIWLTDDNGTVSARPCAIFGVGDDPNEPQWGVMWFLGTPEIRKAPLSIIREAVKWLNHFNKKYPCGIHNIVDSRNDLHLRWLMLTGFTFSDHLYTIQGVPFVHAERHRS